MVDCHVIIMALFFFAILIEQNLTLPPIIMVQWKMGVSPILVSFRVFFHFHDYERKGTQQNKNSLAKVRLARIIFYLDVF